MPVMQLNIAISVISYFDQAFISISQISVMPIKANENNNYL